MLHVSKPAGNLVSLGKLQYMRALVCSSENELTMSLGAKKLFHTPLGRSTGTLYTIDYMEGLRDHIDVLKSRASSIPSEPLLS